jgi:hypothetical protein
MNRFDQPRSVRGMLGVNRVCFFAQLHQPLRYDAVTMKPNTRATRWLYPSKLQRYRPRSGTGAVENERLWRQLGPTKFVFTLVQGLLDAEDRQTGLLAPSWRAAAWVGTVAKPDSLAGDEA